MSTLYDEITDSIIHAIENGAENYVMPWHRDAAAGTPRNAITGRVYQGINRLLLWAAAQQRGYRSVQSATYRQWQEAGAQVRKGERATVILLFKPIPSSAKADDAADRASRALARAFRVFNAEQVDGFEPSPTPTPTLPESERLLIAEQFCSAQRAAVWFGSDSAFYDPRADLISLPSFNAFKSASAYYSVFTHELAHWTGAKSRLDRNLAGRFGSEAYAMEELIAELAAAFVAAHLGLCSEPRRDHAPYIASWLRVLRSDSRAIMLASSRAQAAADFLISQASAGPGAALPAKVLPQTPELAEMSA